jgi:hypothetical protein
MRPLLLCTVLLCLLVAGQASVLLQEQQCDANKARWDYSKCYAASEFMCRMQAHDACWAQRRRA